MRRVDDTPVDPEVAAALDAIDGTLAGDPVDPAHAELAELALLLAGERPRPDPAVANALDQRVQRRFAAAPRAARRRARWVWAPAAAVVACAAVAVVIVAGGGSTAPGPRPAPAVSGTAASSASAPSSAAKLSPAGSSTARSATAAGSSTAAGSPVPEQTGSPVPAQAGSLQPPPNGRKIVQGAQLALSTSPSRVDSVAQEVFDVVGQQRGIVNSSTVSAGGGGGYAQFQLSVPSGSLPQAMAALSSLRYAHVASRTDTTHDVNDQYLADQRRLTDARALRTALLKQLAAATSQAQIDSLTARIHDADASISSDEATLRQLNRQVDLSQVSVTISAGSVPIPAGHGSGGFTLGTAAHDAGRVLTIAAGIALIVLAALVPVALLGGAGLWIAATVRRRRREQALDAV